MSALSQSLYLELLAYSRSRLFEFLRDSSLYPTQLNFDQKFNTNCVSLMYEEQRPKDSFSPRQDFWPKIEGLKDACASCWSFYLNPRNSSVKSLDIRLGKNFESEFMGFLASKGFLSVRGDVKRKNFPDIAILRQDQQPACYLELKYLTAPYVKIYLFVKGRECYEGSTTLDTGEKIDAQRKIVEAEISVPVFYTYWIDYPCIKGVFFMESHDVYEHIDSVQGTEWVRKQRTGDFIETEQGMIRVGHLNKVYLPLLRMGNFEELLQGIPS